MKRKVLERALRKLGWSLVRHGGLHDIWGRGLERIPVPRHGELNEYTAKAILREARGE